MGLFDVFRRKETPPAVTAENITPVVEDERFKNRFYQDVNLTEKNVKVEFDEDEKLIKGTCYLQAAHNNIQMYQEGNLIFEVSKRSKAYKELEPFVGQNVWYVVLKKRKGDYGLYYQAMIKHKLSNEEAQEILSKHNGA